MSSWLFVSHTCNKVTNTTYIYFSERKKEDLENVYQNLLRSQPPSVSNTEHFSPVHEVTVEEVPEPVSKENETGSEIIGRSGEMDVSMAMGTPGYVERVRESFLRSSYN